MISQMLFGFMILMEITKVHTVEHIELQLEHLLLRDVYYDKDRFWLSEELML